LKPLDLPALSPDPASDNPPQIPRQVTRSTNENIHCLFRTVAFDISINWRHAGRRGKKRFVDGLLQVRSTAHVPDLQALRCDESRGCESVERTGRVRQRRACDVHLHLKILGLSFAKRGQEEFESPSCV